MNALPPLSPEDRIPDDRAVWRDPPCAPGIPGFVSITVEYLGGFKEQTTVAGASWGKVIRYRFGWAPQPQPSPFEGLGLAAKE